MPRSADEVRFHGVRLTHPDRVLYAEQGITKRDLAAYYAAVAPRMVPQLRGRPLTLVRCPAGQEGTCFYQRRPTGGFPEALRRVEIPDPDGGESATYLTADSLRAVVSLVQVGVLEMHTWSARRDRLDRPDRLVFDLDPDEGLPWSTTVDAALETRALLEGAGMRSFVKTTGGKGLHVVVPLVRTAGWDEAHRFAGAVAAALERAAPERYLTEASREERHGKVFVDWLRNSWSASAVAAYSTRSRPGAPVSTPVTWDELRAGIDPRELTVTTVPGRVERARDPWAEYDAARARITRAAWEAMGAEAE